MRNIPEKCEAVDGEKIGAAVMLIYCDGKTDYSFSINGINPLYLCAKHCKGYQKSHSYYKEDIEVVKL